MWHWKSNMYSKNIFKKHYLYIYIKHKKIEQDIFFFSYLVSFYFIRAICERIKSKKKTIFNVHKIFNILIIPPLLFVMTIMILIQIIVNKELKILSLFTWNTSYIYIYILVSRIASIIPILTEQRLVLLANLFISLGSS